MKKEVSKARGKTYGSRKKEKPVIDLDIFESDSSHSSQFARNVSERSAYTHDGSTMYSESVESTKYRIKDFESRDQGITTRDSSDSNESRANNFEFCDRGMATGESSDSDENESAEFTLQMIGNIFMCGTSPWDSKDEQTVNYEIDDDGSVFSASSKYSTHTASDHQQDMMSKMSKKFEYSKGMTRLGRVNDDDDDTCGYEGSDEQLGTLDEMMTRLRVNNDTPLYKSSVDSEATVAKALSETVPQAVSHMVSNTLKKIDFDFQPSLLYRAIDTRSWKHAYEILRKSPKEASTWVYRVNEDAPGYKWIFLPIHVACFSGAPSDLVKGLVRAYPQGVRMTANGGKLPLHIACETLAGSTVITFLHKVYSEAQYAIDESGNTPLQRAMFCESKPGRARIMKLLIALSASDSHNNSDNENCMPENKPAPTTKSSKSTLR